MNYAWVLALNVLKVVLVVLESTRLRASGKAVRVECA